MTHWFDGDWTLEKNSVGIGSLCVQTDTGDNSPHTIKFIPRRVKNSCDTPHTETPVALQVFFISEQEFISFRIEYGGSTFLFVLRMIYNTHSELQRLDGRFFDISSAGISLAGATADLGDDDGSASGSRPGT